MDDVANRTEYGTCFDLPLTIFRMGKVKLKELMAHILFGLMFPVTKELAFMELMIIIQLDPVFQKDASV